MFDSIQIDPVLIDAVAATVKNQLGLAWLSHPQEGVVLAMALEKVADQLRKEAAAETEKAARIVNGCKAMELYMADLLFAIHAKEESDRDSRLLEAANLIQQQIAGLRRGIN